MGKPKLIYTEPTGGSCVLGPDTSAVLTWLFGWLNQLRVQVRAVLRIYSALVLLPASAYSVETYPCGRDGHRFTMEVDVFKFNSAHRESITHGC